MKAVFTTGGKQYYVTEGDEIFVIPNTINLNKNNDNSSKTIKKEITINQTIPEEGSIFLPFFLA